MEETLVKFISHNYRTLLQSKLEALNELDSLFRKQNKQVLEKLFNEGLIDENGMPVGVIKMPKNKKEAEISYKKAFDVGNKFKEYGGKEEILIDINELINKLTITNTDITKCLIP